MTINERLSTILAELLAGGIGLEQAMEQIEGKYIDAALQQANGNITKAAHLLQVHRNTLHTKIRIGVVPGRRPKRVFRA